jgi:hypothetical protein
MEHRKCAACESEFSPVREAQLYCSSRLQHSGSSCASPQEKPLHQARPSGDT